MEDTLWAGLSDSYINTPMGVTAENLAEKYGITRLEADEYALASQERWGKGTDVRYDLFMLLLLFLNILCLDYFFFFINALLSFI